MIGCRFFIGILVASSVMAGTPAEEAIAQARSSLERKESASGYAALSMAYARRARETADGEYYRKGHEALDRALELEKDSYQVRRIRPWLLLGQHEFAVALDTARALNREYPDDIMVWGMLTDAHVEMGNYDKAVEAAQWMLDMRPGNVPGLTRAAYLRELHGEEDGALELLRMAYGRVRDAETEERAWIVCQMAHVERQRGQAEEALRLAEEALAIFPGYHYALAEQGWALLALGRADEAVAAFQTRYKKAPHPENLFDVGVALDAAGRSTEAQAAFVEFETAALEESESNDNANGQLVSLYVDHIAKPAQALRIAEMEYARRKDVFTRMALAWALHANGESAQAWEHARQVLDRGVRSAEICYRAGELAMASGDEEKAGELFAEALRRAPSPQIEAGVRAASQDAVGNAE